MYRATCYSVAISGSLRQKERDVGLSFNKIYALINFSASSSFQRHQEAYTKSELQEWFSIESLSNT